MYVKTFIKAIVTAVFVLTVFSVSVSAYIDVRPEDWFFSDVTALSEAGIINGYPDGGFAPDKSITCAEFIKLLVLSLDMDKSDGEQSYSGEAHWADKYISSLVNASVIDAADLSSGLFSPDIKITRGYMTELLVLALGLEPVSPGSPFSDTSDIYAETAYNEYLLMGYIIDNERREYRRQTTLTRAEAASVLVRAMDYKHDRVKYRDSRVLQNAENNYLICEQEFIDLFHVMNKSFMTECTFKTLLDFSEWERFFFRAQIIFPECYIGQTYLCEYTNGKNQYKIKIIYDRQIDVAKALQKKAADAASEVALKILEPDMTDIEKLRAIHDYLILNCEYDYNSYKSGTIPFESYMAYGVFNSGKAVCQGYSAAFNLLCEIAGIRSIGVNGNVGADGSEHMWNAVLLDGKVYFIDVTYDDPIQNKKGIYYKYFCLTAEELEQAGYAWNYFDADIKYLYRK